MTTPSGRSAPRSKNGCSTCRIRKVKCDERHPTCSKCSSARLTCEWTRDVPSRRSVASHKAKRKVTECSLQPRLDMATPVASDGSTPSKRDETMSHTTETLVDSPEMQTLVRYNNTQVANLPTTQSPTTVAVSSSRILTAQDLVAFSYVPESLMVVRFGKPWRWSMLSYLHSKIAPHDPGVMSAFIAVASMELRFRDSVQYSNSVVSQSSIDHANSLRDSATTHFHIAIKHLCSMLDRMSNTQTTSDEIDALFAVWFLILHCQLYDPELVRASQIHLNGIRSFIAKYLWEDETGTRELPPASQQLLLFITYLDVNLALGNLNGGQLCLDLLSIPKDSPLSYDRIWEAARICLPKLWGSEYPPEEILDDVENYRGLHFLHSCQKLKISLWQIVVASGKGETVHERKQHLFGQIKLVGQDFMDLLTLARVMKNSGGRRVIWTIYHACLDYHALKVLYSCLEENDALSEWTEEALSELLAIAHKSYDEDPQQVYRTSWPLAVALLKVKDPIHRDWVKAQLRRVRVLLSDIGLPSRLLDGPTSPKYVFLEYQQIRDDQAE